MRRTYRTARDDGRLLDSLTTTVAALGSLGSADPQGLADSVGVVVHKLRAGAASGAAFALAWTRCVGPTLGAILSAPAVSSSALHGAVPLGVLLGRAGDRLVGRALAVVPEDVVHPGPLGG